jgi:hypothetical protein
MVAYSLPHAARREGDRRKATSPVLSQSVASIGPQAEREDRQRFPLVKKAIYKEYFGRKTKEQVKR